MRCFTLFIIGSLLLLAPGCKKSAELETDFIPVFAGDVTTDVSYKKISFSASFEKMDPSNALDCGFEWGLKSLSKKSSVSVGLISDRFFSVQLSEKLEEGAEYEVRAWIQAGSKKFYSKPVLFYGAIAKKPEIISINRTYALWGDTIRFKVRNLTTDILPSDVTITIENSNIQPIYVDTTEITFIWPFSATNGNLNITLKVNNHFATNTVLIENALPEVTSVAPLLVHIGDLITIKGKFRSEYAGRIVPSRCLDWNNPISFEVLGFTDDEIRIKYTDELVCDPNSNLSFNIYSHAGDQNYNIIHSGFTLTRDSHWSRLNSSYPWGAAKGVAIDGTGYVIEKNFGWPPSPFWKYNPSTDQLTYLPSLPVLIPDDGCMVVCKGEIYAGLLRTTNQTSNFYKYNLNVNNWIECADLAYIDGTITRTTATIENKIFVFMSGSNKRCVYDPANDSWTITPCSVPVLIESARMFVYNGEYYFYKGKDDNALYKYVLAENKFYRVNLEGMANGRSTFFTLEDKYFLNVGCDVYEINMAAAKLQIRPEFSNFADSYNIYGDDSFLFEIGNKAYFFSNPYFMESFSMDAR